MTEVEIDGKKYIPENPELAEAINNVIAERDAYKLENEELKGLTKEARAEKEKERIAAEAEAEKERKEELKKLRSKRSKEKRKVKKLEKRLESGEKVDKLGNKIKPQIDDYLASIYETEQKINVLT